MSSNDGINLDMWKAAQRSNLERNTRAQSQVRRADLDRKRAQIAEEGRIRVMQKNKSEEERRNSLNKQRKLAESRNIKGAKTKSKAYEASLKRNGKKLSKSLAIALSVGALAIGGLVGSRINAQVQGNQEYVLNDYSPKELFDQTNLLIQDVAENTYFEEHPDEKDEFKGYDLESYTEQSVYKAGGEVTLKLNYSKYSTNGTGMESKSCVVTLPEDFAKDVYLGYKDLRQTSNVDESKKEKTAYWMKMNKSVGELVDGLNHYIENSKDKDVVESAKDALEAASYDDER